MSEGIVYVLTHSAMDGYVKIGRTDNLPERLRNLFNSSVPAPFDCYFAARVADMETVERSLHEVFGDKRVHPRREFFTADPHRVRVALQMVALDEVTPGGIAEPEDVAAAAKVNEARERRDRFNFEEVGVAVGTVLTFIDQPEVTCTTVSDNPPRVEFNDQVTSLSRSAQEVLGKDYGVNGILYWCYGEETLSEIRDAKNPG